MEKRIDYMQKIVWGSKKKLLENFIDGLLWYRALLTMDIKVRYECLWLKSSLNPYYMNVH